MTLGLSWEDTPEGGPTPSRPGPSPPTPAQPATGGKEGQGRHRRESQSRSRLPVHTCGPAPPAQSPNTQAQTFSSSSTTLHPLQVPTPDSSLFSILSATAHPISSAESMKASTCVVHTLPAASRVISPSEALHGTYCQTGGLQSPQSKLSSTPVSCSSSMS